MFLKSLATIHRHVPACAMAIATIFIFVGMTQAVSQIGVIA